MLPIGSPATQSDILDGYLKTDMEAAARVRCTLNIHP
jgi:hypothetical protein